ncbi:MAG: hypothetical protein ABIG90_00930 [bacterium]
MNKLAIKSQKVKFVSWQKAMPRIFNFNKNSNVGVFVDSEGAPKAMIFDVNSFLDMLSEIDEKLVDKFSTQDYYSKKHNPAGWLIDEIESKLPVNPKYANSLKQIIAEANKKGWIPFKNLCI